MPVGHMYAAAVYCISVAVGKFLQAPDNPVVIVGYPVFFQLKRAQHLEYIGDDNIAADLELLKFFTVGP